MSVGIDVLVKNDIDVLVNTDFDVLANTNFNVLLDELLSRHWHDRFSDGVLIRMGKVIILVLEVTRLSVHVNVDVVREHVLLVKIQHGCGLINNAELLGFLGGVVLLSSGGNLRGGLADLVRADEEETNTEAAQQNQHNDHEDRNQGGCAGFIQIKPVTFVSDCESIGGRIHLLSLILQNDDLLISSCLDLVADYV